MSDPRNKPGFGPGAERAAGGRPCEALPDFATRSTKSKMPGNNKQFVCENIDNFNCQRRDENRPADESKPAEEVRADTPSPPPVLPLADRPLKLAEDKRVLVALSGGVDSSVAVHLLQQQGYDVEAAVISFSYPHNPYGGTHAGALKAALQAAGQLRVPISVLHAEHLFEEAVVSPFCAAYTSGRTPNPCVVCNPLVKFRVLADEAEKRGIFHIASGHYARCDLRGAIRYIARAASDERDQSYMLYRLPADIRNRLLLPVGELSKPAVREVARALSLACADAPDSQEICFIPAGDYAAFIEGRGLAGKPGNFIGPRGEDLGPHRGVQHYTIGQRKGLGIALGVPVFVRRIEQNGDIRLAEGGGEFAEGVRLRNVVTASGGPLRDRERAEVKIRSMAPAVPCTVRFTDAGVTLQFDAPQRAAAPGQHAVLYKGPLVIGGGEIEDMF